MGESFFKISDEMEKYLKQILRKIEKKHARYGNKRKFLT